jgi:2-(1,2-epoxy-1,2-dihydrophenyl)acetyl-CoA isomerase
VTHTNTSVVVEREQAVYRITLNRPEVLNAYNGAVSAGLMGALAEAAEDRSVRVVVLQGAGGNFSSGADMRLLNEEVSPDKSLQLMKGLSKLVIAMRELPQPIICKVQGVAYGVGANIALAGDFTIAAHTARICEVFIHIGVIMDGGGHYFLPRLVGMAKARELAMLGGEVDGRTAAAMGLVYRSVPEAEIDNEVEQLIGSLMMKSPDALALIKEGLEGSLTMSLRDVMEWEASHQSIMLQTRTHKDAVRSFLKARRKKKR